MAGGLITENCEGKNLLFIGDSLLTDGCPQVIQRTYRFADACGNISDAYKQKITINDTIPPKIDCPPSIPPFKGDLNDLLAKTGLGYSETIQNIEITRIASTADFNFRQLRHKGNYLPG